MSTEASEAVSPELAAPALEARTEPAAPRTRTIPHSGSAPARRAAEATTTVPSAPPETELVPPTPTPRGAHVPDVLVDPYAEDP